VEKRYLIMTVKPEGKAIHRVRADILQEGRWHDVLKEGGSGEEENCGIRGLHQFASMELMGIGKTSSLGKGDEITEQGGLGEGGGNF